MFGAVWREVQRAARQFAEQYLPPGSRNRTAAIAAAVLTALGSVLTALITAASARRAVRTARFAVRVATLRLYLPCADCRKRIHTDARVCRHCGYRKPVGRRRRYV